MYKRITTKKDLVFKVVLNRVGTLYLILASFSAKTALILYGVDCTMIRQSLYFFQIHFLCCESTVLSSPKCVVLDSGLVTGKACKEYWPHFLSKTLQKSVMAFKWCPKCPKKTFPTPLCHIHQPGLVRSTDLCFWHQVLTLSSVCICRYEDYADQAIFFRSSAVLFWWACDSCSWLRKMVPGCRPFPQVSKCCAYRNAFLFTKIVQSV